MKIAGIRLPDGSALWVEAGEMLVAPLDEARVRLTDAEATGTVFVAPEQMISPPQRTDGMMVEVRQREAPEEECGNLPGSDMPYLGSRIRVGALTGTVTAIDAMRRLATVTSLNGGSMEISVDTSSGTNHAPPDGARAGDSF